MVPFAGWEMPVQYEGIRQEHVNVRRHAGLFDVSHMGEIETSGPEAESFLQRILSNDVTKIADHGAQYSVLCNEQGKVLDDLGSQGEWPTHPELLDWMASEFMQGGWDMKHMVRLIVTSQTYR